MISISDSPNILKLAPAPASHNHRGANAYRTIKTLRNVCNLALPTASAAAVIYHFSPNTGSSNLNSALRQIAVLAAGVAAASITNRVSYNLQNIYLSPALYSCDSHQYIKDYQLPYMNRLFQQEQPQFAKLLQEYIPTDDFSLLGNNSIDIRNLFDLYQQHSPDVHSCKTNQFTKDTTAAILQSWCLKQCPQLRDVSPEQQLDIIKSLLLMQIFSRSPSEKTGQALEALLPQAGLFPVNNNAGAQSRTDNPTEPDNTRLPLSMLNDPITGSYIISGTTTAISIEKDGDEAPAVKLYFALHDKVFALSIDQLRDLLTAANATRPDQNIFLIPPCNNKYRFTPS